MGKKKKNGYHRGNENTLESTRKKVCTSPASKFYIYMTEKQQ